MSNVKRETLASSLGFLLVSAGCAVGIGNVWRFPYIVGEYGGALFVLFFVVLLAFFGLPMMVAEFAVGRASGRTLPRAYTELVPKTKFFPFLGKFQVAGNWLLLMSYTTVAGWMLAYAYKALTGTLKTETGDQAMAAFGTFTQASCEQIFWMSVVLGIGVLVCSIGLRKGVERVTKFMMAVLFVLLIVLAGYVMTLPGAMEGLRFYLQPNLDVLQSHSLTEILFAALGQCVFTLSIGMGGMAIFGSYTSKAHSLTGEGMKVIAIDLLVAFLAGLIIFPACAAYHVEPGQGPKLIFSTLPVIFADMPFGRVIGSSFFLLLSLAALTTVIAVYENVLAIQMDSFGFTRKKAVLCSAPVIWVLSIPCALGFGLLSGFEPMGEGTCILDLEDFIVSNVLLPLGSLAVVLFCVLRRFWGWKNFETEVNTGTGLRLPKFFRFYMTWILPVIIVVVFLTFIAEKFGLGKLLGLTA